MRTPWLFLSIGALLCGCPDIKILVSLLVSLNFGNSHIETRLRLELNADGTLSDTEGKVRFGSLRIPKHISRIVLNAGSEGKGMLEVFSERNQIPEDPNHPDMWYV